MNINFRRPGWLRTRLVCRSLLLLGWLGRAGALATGGDWSVYLGDKAQSHFSPLKQLRASNVGRLEVAWTYHSGDARKDNLSHIQCNPIIVAGVLFGTTPQIKLVRLRGLQAGSYGGLILSSQRLGVG